MILRFSILLLSIISCFNLLAQDLSLIIEYKNGNKIKHELTHNPVISFDTESLSISFDGSIMAYYYLKDIQKIYYDKTSDIKVISDDNYDECITSSGNNLMINTSKGGTGEIFNLKGLKVLSFVTYPNQQNTIQLDMLRNGMYILRLNELSLKIVKK